ncbi:MAG: hypothetical protein WBG15_00215, partial [Xanthobacteraceae bacterium]
MSKHSLASPISAGLRNIILTTFRFSAFSHSLAVQLRFSFEVCVARFGLVGAPPERPCDDMGGLDAPLGELDGDAADFL